MNDDKLVCSALKLSTLMEMLNLQPKDLAQKFGVRAGDIYHLRSEKSGRLKPLHIYALMAAYNLPARLFTDETLSDKEIERIIKGRDKNKIEYKAQETKQFSKNIEKIVGEWFVYVDSYSKSNFTVWEYKMTITQEGKVYYYNLRSNPNEYLYDGDIVEKNGKFFITLDRTLAENRIFIQFSIDNISDRFPVIYTSKTLPLGLDISEIVIFSRDVLVGKEAKIEAITSNRIVIDKNLLDTVYNINKSNIDNNIEYYTYNYSSDLKNQMMYWKRKVTITSTGIECHFNDKSSYYGSLISKNDEDSIYHLIKQNTQQNCYLIIRTKELNTKEVFVAILVNYRLIDGNDRVVKTILFSKNELDEDKARYILGTYKESSILIDQSNINRKIFELIYNQNIENLKTLQAQKDETLEKLIGEWHYYAYGAIMELSTEYKIWHSKISIDENANFTYIHKNFTQHKGLVDTNYNPNQLYIKLTNSESQNLALITIDKKNLYKDIFKVTMLRKQFGKDQDVITFGIFSKYKLDITLIEKAFGDVKSVMLREDYELEAKINQLYRESKINEIESNQS